MTLNPGNLVATLAGEPLALKPKEFALLELLLRNKGRVLPRKLIEEKLYNWDDDVSSNAVEVHVHHLRRKLGSEFIRTVHGIGYTRVTHEIDATSQPARQADAYFPDSGLHHWAISSFVARRKTTDNVDELFDTQLMLFARRLSTLDLNEINARSAWRIRQRN